MKFLLWFITLLLTLSFLRAEEDRGYALSTVIWDSTTIPVCWESYSQSTATNRSWVRNAITSTWQDNSKLRFIGWGQCASSSNGIRIRVEDRGPHTKGLGDNLAGMTNGMVLNFTYQNWSPSCQNNKQYCSEVIAVHEFGHALGFAHEQNRDDTPATCDDAPQGTNGDTIIGSWDLYSVMNYCNPTYSGNGELSDTDLKMLHQFYGYGSNPLNIPTIQRNTTVHSSWNASIFSTHLAQRYAKYYTFTLKKNTEVTITLQSNEDTFLILLKGKGRTGLLIDVNDGYEGYTNSRITKNLSAGKYTIEATTYGRVTTGNFSLDLNYPSSEYASLISTIYYPLLLAN